MGKPHDHHHHASKLPSSAISKLETSITLKVLIHCEGCRRKVKRIIKCVDGVESVTIEPENGKVVVSGKGVDAKDVLQNLHKAGKHAEIWHFGGGKGPHMSLPTTTNRPTNNLNSNSHNNSNANNMKAVGWDPKLNVEEKKGVNSKGKGNESNNLNFNASGGGNTNFGHGKLKGGEMVELANLVPQKPPNFPSGGYSTGGHFENPSFPSNNVAILNKSMAPIPSVYHGETSQGPQERSEYASADYATHLFSDENANNCSIM